jgi:4-amino-4-deoxy-L-arabinose transferase-like glycosyltransferase
VEQAGTRAGATRASRHFWIGLALIALAGLAWRLIYINWVGTDFATYGDSFFYHQQANFLADGHGFASPDRWRSTGEYSPTSFHPPLYPMVLSISSFLGFDGYLAHRVTSCIIGAAAVAVVGLIGRRVGGNLAGLIAAGLAAAYPNLWMIDGILFPEGLFALTIGLTILAAYWLHDQPTWWRAAVLGATVALAALTRGEAILLLAFLILPLILFLRGVAWKRRFLLLVVAGLGTVIVMAPWTIRNLTTFNEPVLVSSNGDAVLAFANCNAVYYGPIIGFWYMGCPKTFPSGDESEVAKGYRQMGLDYISSHTRRLPVVVAARVGRIWQVYKPFQNAQLSEGELRPKWATLAGLWTYWVLLPLAFLGGWLTFRRRVTLIPLLAQAVLVTFTAATVYATNRFALPAEVAIISLAGVGISGLVTRVRHGTFLPPVVEPRDESPATAQVTPASDPSVPPTPA